MDFWRFLLLNFNIEIVLNMDLMGFFFLLEIYWFNSVAFLKADTQALFLLHCFFQHSEREVLNLSI